MDAAAVIPDPELRPPPPPPPEPPSGMDDSQFLGSMMGDTVLAQPAPTQQPAPSTAPGPAPAHHHQQQQQVVPAAPTPKKRGRPPRSANGAAAVAGPPAVLTPAAARRAEAKAAKISKELDEDEVVCFICFDGGDLVVCDRRGCPKVYHPACIKRDESFFTSRTKWNCGWHICSSCEKAAHYMCYTCTFSVCKVCVKQGKFFSVRGAKGFCDTCFGTILLIETKDEGDGTKVRVDFDDRLTWEYLFKLYWMDLKGKLSLTMEELTGAKSRWSAPVTYARKEKDESSDDLYDANDDDGGGKRRRANSSRKRGKKRGKPHSVCTVTVEDVKIATGNAEKLPKKEPSDGVSLPRNTKWASPELLEFVGHMRDGDQSFISQFDVQALLLDYIKKNDLRDPRRKSQVICDSRLHRLFRKKHVAHFEMLRLLETHCPASDASTVNNGNCGSINLNSAQIDASGYGEVADKLYPDRKKRMHRKMEREPPSNLSDYAAIDMHNISLIYLRRSLMEDLIDDPTFSDKVSGGFVRIKITDVGQKQDMYRLVKVVGTHKVSEKYNIGKKMTNFTLEILNLTKKEIITMDTISNQDFTQEECKRLRQSMKYGLIDRLKVGDIQDKATVFQSVRVNDWLENEKQRLGYLRDRASETGRRKELRECVEKLQLLNNSDERTRRINEILEVHVDSHMDPDYESAEEMDDKRAAERNESGKRSNGFFSPIKVQNYAKIMSDAIRHPKNLSKQSTVGKLGAGRNSRKSHSTTGTDVPKSGSNVSSKMCEASPLSSPGSTPSTDLEPEKVWHYKDPSGNVQGPFTLVQLSKWTAYFPRDLRVWLIFESEETSLLLTEVLSKQPKDLGQVPSVRSSKTKLAGSGQHRNISSNVDLNSTPSPVGYSRFNSSETTVQSTEYSVPEKASVPHSSDDLQRGNNNGHNRGDRWSPSTTQTSCSGQNNVESHHNQHASRSQAQHKSSLQAGCVKDLDSRQDYSHAIPTQLTRRDVPSPVLALSPSESRTASSQHESSCLSSTNPSVHDELHSSITSEKTKSCAPATSVEDRGSSSPSGMLAHSERVPVYSHQSVPSTAIPEICKVGEIKNEEKTREADASNVSVNQSPQSKMFPDSSPDNQDTDRAYPIPAEKSESKKADVAHSERVPVCSPKSVPAAAIPEICKAGEIKNEEKTREADASNVSVNQSPQSKMFPDSSPDNQDTDRAYPIPAEKSESKKADVAHSERVPVCSPKSVPAAAIPEICKAGEIKNEEKTREADASHASVNQSPQSKTFPDSSPDNQDIDHEYSNPTQKSESKKADVAQSGWKSATPETLDTKIPNHSPVSFVSPKFDLPTGEIGATDSVPNLEKTDVSGLDLNTQKECWSEFSLAIREEVVTDPASCAKSLDASDVPESACDLPTGEIGGADNVEKTVLSGEDSNTQKECYSKTTLVTREKSVADCACAEPINTPDIPKSVSNLEKRDSKGQSSDIQKELYNESILVTSEKLLAGFATCAKSIDRSSVLERDLMSADANIQKELYSKSTQVTSEKTVVEPASCAESAGVSNVLGSVSILERRDLNLDEDSIPQKELFSDSTLVTGDKMVVKPVSRAGSADVSNVLGSVSILEGRDLNLDEDSITQKELFSDATLVTGDNMVVKPVCHAESVCNLEGRDLNIADSIVQKELGESTLVTSNKMVVDPASCADVSDVLESVFNLERAGLKGDHSNIQEMYGESTLVTRENTVTDPASCLESVHVSDVLEPVSNLDLEKTYLGGEGSDIQKELHEGSTLVTRDYMVADPAPCAESLTEQNRGTLCMDALAAIEQFMTASPEEEPQCSSPIALSPWGESGYYQGDTVDSGLWGVQDDTINEMWSLLSPTPALQHLPAVKSEMEGVAQGEYDFFQRDPTPAEQHWGLTEQVKPKATTAAPASSIDVNVSTGLFGWQPSASEIPNVGATWSTSDNPNLYTSYGAAAAPSVRTSQQVSVKQEYTELDAANFGGVLGNNTKTWNAPAGNAANFGGAQGSNTKSWNASAGNAANFGGAQGSNTKSWNTPAGNAANFGGAQGSNTKSWNAPAGNAANSGGGLGSNTKSWNAPAGNAANSGGPLGSNTKSWNAPAGNAANRGNQRRDRYSQISESWLLSSSNSRK